MALYHKDTISLQKLSHYSLLAIEDIYIEDITRARLILSFQFLCDIRSINTILFNRIKSQIKLSKLLVKKLSPHFIKKKLIVHEHGILIVNRKTKYKTHISRA